MVTFTFKSSPTFASDTRVAVIRAIFPVEVVGFVEQPITSKGIFVVKSFKLYRKIFNLTEFGMG